MLLVGLLGLASGLLKLRTRARQTTGYSQLAIVEALLGAITLCGSGVGLARTRPLAWALVFVTLVMVFISTWAHAKLVRRLVEKRRATEELRLQTYLHTHKGDSE